MDESYFIRNVPRRPGIYAMRTKADDVAYVGLSKNLHDRIDQHLYLRDSSVTTGVQATLLNPDQIARVDYWLDAIFEDPDTLRAAEVIAFEVFTPSLRSRGRNTKAATAMLEDVDFVRQVKSIINAPPSGSHTPQNLPNLWRLVEELSTEVGILRGLARRTETGDDR